MKKKFAALGKRLKKVHRDEKAQNYIRPALIALLFVVACLVSINRESNPEGEKYKLVDGFFITGLRFDGKEEVVCHLFFYDNQETQYNNIDLIVGLNTQGKIFMVREVDKKGRFPMRKSLPADFPRHKIPKVMRKGPQKLPPRERGRRSRDEKGIVNFKRNAGGIEVAI